MNRTILRRLFIAAWLIALSAFPLGGRVFAQSMEFVALLSASNEVPPNPSSASGMVTAALIGNTLTVSGTFSGLSSPLHTMAQGGIHIHIGFAGQNGPILFPLNPTMNGDNLGGMLSAENNSFALNSEQIRMLTTHGMYVNVHSDHRPSGEIRGQILPEGGTYFHVNLSGRAELTPGEMSTTKAIGAAVVELRNDTLIVSGSFTGLESDVTMAHIHIGSADTSGPVAFPLTITSGGNGGSGMFLGASNTFKLTAEQLTALNEGDLYINVHSTNRMGGEIRGQILPEETVVFEAYLSGRNETARVTSGGSGSVVAILQGNELKVAGSFRNLTSPFVMGGGGAHLHMAAVGANGDVIVPLNVTLDEGNMGGRITMEANTFVLTTSQREALLGGRIYANIHSQNYPMGELRGQLLPSTNLPPAASTILSPTNGTTITLPDNLLGNLEAQWQAAPDPNNDQVRYIWEISDQADFTGFYMATGLDQTNASVPYLLIDNLLSASGIEIGPEGLTLYHRLITTDGSLWTVGETGTLILRTDVSGVKDRIAATLFGNARTYPNPFTDETSIRFTLAEPSAVRLELFDPLGQRVQSIRTEMRGEGEEEVRIDAAGLMSGVYTYRLTSSTEKGEATTTGRMTLVR